ncbi:hypothetical protein LRP67_02990 [Nocardioides sp. cx-169]|uniref:hypothetical protein n=1 Tax=Nocardioides sp. cx-169 TaxID=2899080 RepID=UPI001E580969|nr:hypothetical protein [Nocardioides sp. cx-169]MCD4533045.1 hypothetical protein [Nocardioides sp. cx-169]
MASIHHRAPLEVSADTAWDFLECYARASVHVFSSCVGERLVDDFRVVTLGDGTEIWERNVTVDPVHRRASYTTPGLHDAEHHHAEMRIEEGADGVAHLVWVTDYLPHSLAEDRAPVYEGLFGDLLAAVNGHRGPATD